MQNRPARHACEGMRKGWWPLLGCDASDTMASLALPQHMYCTGSGKSLCCIAGVFKQGALCCHGACSQETLECCDSVRCAWCTPPWHIMHEQAHCASNGMD